MIKKILGFFLEEIEDDFDLNEKDDLFRETISKKIDVREVFKDDIKEKKVSPEKIVKKDAPEENKSDKLVTVPLEKEKKAFNYEAEVNNNPKEEIKRKVERSTLEVKRETVNNTRINKAYHNNKIDYPNQPKKEVVQKPTNTFKPSPIISPIYGIIDKKERDEVLSRKKESKTSYENNHNTLFDDVRNKAFNSTVKPTDDTVLDDEGLISFEFPGVDNMTVDDAFNNYNNARKNKKETEDGFNKDQESLLDLIEIMSSSKDE